MRVFEIAKEFNVSAEALVQLLREMDIPVRSHMTPLGDEHVARLRTIMERERRSGKHSAEEAIGAALEEASQAPRRRRRRKVEDETPAPDAGEEDSTASPTADAAEAIAAEAAAEAPAEELASPPVPELEEEAPAAPAPPPEPEVRRAPGPGRLPPRPENQPERRPVTPVRPAAEAAPRTEEAPRPAEGRAPESARPRPARADAAPPTPVRRGAPPAPARLESARPAAGAAASDASKRRKKDKKRKKGQVDQDAVDETFRRTMAAMEGSGTKRRKRPRDTGPSHHERMEEERQRIAAEEATIVRVNEFLTIAELSELIDVPPTQLVSSAFKNLGLMVTINQRLDFDQIELLLDEFGFRAIREDEYVGEAEEEEAPDLPEDLKPRPPVVTVMGHVDHGKTSLLDYIRKANVIAGEAGGITQHIGAYHVEVGDGRSMSFLDTPGHAAFTAMRARGAEVTDVVILVVAADDSVMPQTIEAISHAKNAGVPIVVAVNKVDLPDSNPNKVKQDLLQHGLVLEEFGGEVLSADVSAKQGTGVDELLEKVLLQAEILELKANPDRDALGTVIEAQLDVGKGPVATVLVTNGTLRVGDHVVCGLHAGRVRAMLDERGKAVTSAGPAVPVQILGLPGVPGAGDPLQAMPADRAMEISQTRSRLEREKRIRIKSRGVKLTDISRMLERGETAHLNIVIKGDVDGSVQALSDSLEQLSTTEVKVQVIHRAVGAINESDVLLASTSGAIVIGFHVRPSPDARAVAEREDVDIRLYSIIYEAVAEVRAAMEGLLSPEEREVLLGVAEVRQLFKVPRIGTVAGCMVTQGEIVRRGQVRVVRDGLEIYQGELGSLKRFKDDVREVREGFECGLNVSNFNDIKVGDLIESYRVDEIARTLAGSAE
jgi:translation initiation factor IF-2